MLRRWTWAALSGGIVSGALVTGFAPVVRYEAVRVAERYGGGVTIERIVPQMNGVRLKGVEVKLDAVPSARLHLDEVVVAYGHAGRTVSLRGGVITAVGPREVVMQEVEAWRARHRTGGALDASERSERSTEVAGLQVHWQNDAAAPTETAHASEVQWSRAEGRLTLSAKEVAATIGRNAVSVSNGRIELSRSASGSYHLVGLGAEGLEAELGFPVGKDGTAPPAPAHVAGLGMGARDALVVAAQAVDQVLGPGAGVRLGGVHARIHRGNEVLNLGPGTLQVARASGQLVVELTPELRSLSSMRASAAVAAPEQALTFRLALPLGAEAPREIVADVQGGPIGLASLGVQEGDVGLFDLGHSSLSTRSHLSLAADGRTLRVEGEGKIHGLSIRSVALSDEPVAGLELAFGLKGELDLDGSRARLADAELDLGAIRIIVKGDYDRARGVEDTYRFRGSFDMPLTACQSMLDAVPKGLLPKLKGMRMAGAFALRGQADIDTAHLDRGFRLAWDASNSCRILEVPPDIAVARFREPFRRTAYDPQGRPVVVETGPGRADWVAMSAISKFMEVAVLSTEDAGFHRHHGFDHQAIRNSIRENLRKKKFVRGASTISMQLAKNLYLDRGKNLSRKLQEAVLTMYLEQELTKEQILELYFNVIEFGPMVYGIGPAAQTYFNTTANELSLGQALYLASVMPNPKVQHFGPGGAVAAGWMSYLHKLMKIAHDRHRIADEELEEGLRETVVRGAPPQRSARPVTGPLDPTAPEIPVED